MVDEAVERHDREYGLAARAAVTLSMRKSLPSTVWRATESAGKFVSQMMTSSPWPMARKA
jgi:hypothetical protein